MVVNAPRSQHILMGLNQYDSALLEMRSQIYLKVFRNLDLKIDPYPISIEKLRLMDQVIDLLQITDEFMDQNFLGLCLYSGDLYQTKKGGNWEMRFIEKDKIWVPIFYNKAREEVLFAITLFDYFEDFKLTHMPGTLEAVYCILNVPNNK